MNQQITTHSGTVPGTFRNTNVENQGTNEDDSQSDPHPEAGIFRGQTTQNLGPKDCRDMVTGVTEEIPHCRDMVTGVTGEIRHCRDMVTGATEEIRNGHDMVTAVNIYKNLRTKFQITFYTLFQNNTRKQASFNNFELV